MTGNPYTVSVRTPEILDKLEQHPIWRQRAAGEGARAAGGLARRHRRRLRHQGLRHRRRLLARSRRDRRRRPHHHPLRCGRDGQRHRHRASPTAWRRISAASPTRSRSPQVDAFDALELVTSGDPYTMDQATQDAAQRNPRWVPADQLGDQRLDRRPCRHPGGGRGGARHLPLRPVAGGARAVGHRADRSARQGVGGGALAGRPAHPAGPAAAAAAGDRRAGACAQRRDRRDGARLLALGLVAGDLPGRPARPGRPTSMRSPCAGATAHSRASTARASSFPPTDYNRIGTVLHLAVRHAGPRRDRARDRRAAHRQGLQRLRMRPGAGAGGRARAGAGRLRHGRRLRAARNAAALRGRSRQRAMEPRPISRSPAAPTCRCTTSRSRCCRRCRRTSRRRAWPRW